MLYRETDPRALAVLEGALRSTSAATRIRAVSMLSCLDCERRLEWLSSALADPDASVRATAICVSAWIADAAGPRWPAREDVGSDSPHTSEYRTIAGLPAEPRSRWQWEYVVEVWREDGLLVGVYLAATCSEDDEHARRIALGQAIVESTSRRGDRFDPGSAAAFIVEKRWLDRDTSGPRGRRSGEWWSST